MMNSMQIALTKKDIRAITANKRLFSVLLIVPLMMTVVIPSVFILAAALTPLESNDIQTFTQTFDALETMPEESEIREAIILMICNEVLPLFFLMVPILAASVMAASSFVGEKEKRTLETLLYCPLSLRQIFDAKIIASLLLSQFVSLFSFIVMIIVVQAEVRLMTGSFVALSLSWPILLLLISPATSLIAISLIVRGSAKAKSVEESQQRSAFLVIPIVLLVAMQLSGFYVFSVWVLFGVGVVCAAIALILLRRSSAKLSYEVLLK